MGLVMKEFDSNDVVIVIKPDSSVLVNLPDVDYDKTDPPTHIKMGLVCNQIFKPESADLLADAYREYIIYDDKSCN